MTRVKKIKSDTESQAFKKLFGRLSKNKKYKIISDSLGNLIDVDSSDIDIINYAKSKGLI